MTYHNYYEFQTLTVNSHYQYIVYLLGYDQLRVAQMLGIQINQNQHINLTTETVATQDILHNLQCSIQELSARHQAL